MAKEYISTWVLRSNQTYIEQAKVVLWDMAFGLTEVFNTTRKARRLALEHVSAAMPLFSPLFEELFV